MKRALSSYFLKHILTDLKHGFTHSAIPLKYMPVLNTGELIVVLLRVSK